MDYQKMYYHLFNAMTDAIEEIKRGDALAAWDILVQAQQDAEEMYMQEDPVL